MLTLTLTPWTVRNVCTLHAPVPMRDGDWGEFYAGNNDDTSQTQPGLDPSRRQRSRVAAV